MNMAIVIATVLIAINTLSACSSSDEAIEEEVSHVSNEGPYGGRSVPWYEVHWRTETTEQRNWCRQKKGAADLMQSCVNAEIGWKQGRANPKTNPPRSWEDGSQPIKH
ncbi:MAG: hypothetical protein WAW10_08060 [Gallionella sp.]